MEESGKVAIARLVMRTKEYLAAIRPSGDVLVVSTMVFGDEVVAPDRIDELPARNGKASAKEVEMARKLIESLSVDFDPARYHDEYRERVLDLIERKAAGEEIEVNHGAEEPAAVPDLMAALEASLAESQGKKKPAAKKAAPKKAAPKKSSAPTRKAKAKPKAKST